jgi:uncharacterized membrane protein (UPF0127 family)
VSRRARLRLAAVVAVISAIGIVVLAVQIASRGSGSDGAHLPLGLETRPASAPFAGYRETSIEVDGRCRLVAVADTEALRAQGLREKVKLGRYAGMLFVFGGESVASFTMSGVSQPLEIGWYSGDGKRVNAENMAPCPNRSQADCPIYSAGRSYRVAVERPGGSPSPGQLSPC